jgi:hypothetical protein
MQVGRRSASGSLKNILSLLCQGGGVFVVVLGKLVDAGEFVMPPPAAIFGGSLVDAELELDWLLLQPVKHAAASISSAMAIFIGLIRFKLHFRKRDN